MCTIALYIQETLDAPQSQRSSFLSFFLSLVVVVVLFLALSRSLLSESWHPPLHLFSSSDVRWVHLSLAPALRVEIDQIIGKAAKSKRAGEESSPRTERRFIFKPLKKKEAQEYLYFLSKPSSMEEEQMCIDDGEEWDNEVVAVEHYVKIYSQRYRRVQR